MLSDSFKIILILTQYVSLYSKILSRDMFVSQCLQHENSESLHVSFSTSLLLGSRALSLSEYASVRVQDLRESLATFEAY